MATDNIETWIEVTDPEAVKPGMKIKVIEKYNDGPTVTYEGMVYGTERYYTFEGGGDIVSYKVATQTPDLESVTVYRQPKKLPMYAGSVIKLCHPTYLREMAAIRWPRPGSPDGHDLHWYWVDGVDIVPDHLLENAEVLFDAGKA